MADEKKNDAAQKASESADSKAAAAGEKKAEVKAGPKSKYRVLSHITKDHKGYKPGSVIELSEKEAAAMPWAVEAIAKD